MGPSSPDPASLPGEEGGLLQGCEAAGGGGAAVWELPGPQWAWPLTFSRPWLCICRAGYTWHNPVAQTSEKPRPSAVLLHVELTFLVTLSIA